MIRVALVGVGNAAAAFVQGLEAIKEGLNVFGILDLGINPSDIEIVAAFDIDKRKVGKKLSEALFVKPNVVEMKIPVKSDVTVLRGPTLDGITGILSDVIEESEEKPVDITDVLRSNKVDVVLNLLPTGADQASEYYVKAALEANSAFINATPANIVNKFDKDFKERKLPLFGDDLLSQIGGTAFHAGLIEFLKSRGVKVLRSYQIDIAGTTEAYVALEDWRKDKKKEIKSSFIETHNEGMDIVAGTSDYVEFLGDKRVSYIYIEGIYGYGVPIRVDISLKTYDGPNAVAPLIDLVRLAKIAKDRGIGGAINEICGYYFKNPPVKYKSFSEAREALEKFISMMREPRAE
ncbi:MAG: inositol-3-phosphate synthase [Sulfolobaceae archaeon]|nr:inositol-3-phosphate synthase [Sulfolobaceae archaeon]